MRHSLELIGTAPLSEVLARPVQKHGATAFARGRLVLVWVALALILTWPLAGHLTTALAGPPGDNFEYLWKVWWVRHALVDLGRSPLFNPDIFAPVGYPLALNETTLAHLLPSLPLTLAFGEVASYNLVMLATFMLSGLAMWLLAWRLTGNQTAAWLAGTIWAFSPYRVAHLGAGHLPLMGTAWLPLCLLYADRAIRGARPRDGALAGLFWALAALSSWYYGYLLALFVVLFVALRLRTRLFRLQWVPVALSAVLVAALFVWPALLPLLQLRPTSPHATLRYLDNWSASPLDFLVPSALHPLWGSLVARIFPQNPQERLLSLGWVPLGLALVGVRRRAARPWLLLGLIAAVLALGTTLHLGRGPLSLPAPDWLAGKWGAALALLSERLALNPTEYWGLHREGRLLIPLPTLLLYLFLPFFNAMRVWSRFGLFVTLAVAVLAAYGAAALAAGTGPPWFAGRRSRLVLALAVILTLVELWPAPLAFGWSEVRPQPVDEWLARQSRGSVAVFPTERGWYGYSLWENRAHGQPLAYGYGTFAPPAFEQAAAALAEFPSPASLAQLRAWQVRYLVVTPAGYGPAWPEVETALAAAGLPPVWRGAGRPIYTGDRLLHLLPPDPAVPATEVATGLKGWWVDGDVVIYLIGSAVGEGL